MRTILTLLFLAALPTVGLCHKRSGSLPAGATHDGWTTATSGFEENRGQVRTTSGEAASFVRYRLAQGCTQIFLLESGIAYQFSRMHYPDGYAELMADGRTSGDPEQLDALRPQVRMEIFRMDMTLEGASPSARITTEGRSTDFTQYYNHDALDVHTYTRVTYHEVYPGIDWVVYTTEKGMKYDFVVRPGADPKAIRIRFEHHEELSVDANGNLIHGNRMGRFTEERPVSFQNGKEIATRFVLEGNVLRFALDDYDHGQALTIDPARIWGTYYGGAQYDDALDCATDGDGNVYISGVTASTSAIADGGHQSSLAGGHDAMLVKFNGSGQRLWATYYGGAGTEEGAYCAVDASGNVYLAGTSFSTDGIAAGGHQPANGGSQDAFLVKFDPNGTRLWGTYYGGAAGDDAYGCAVDAANNIYISGRTYSSSGIASGGHQNANNGQPGIADAFLVKFSPAGTRIWGTYYGGEAGATGYGCAVDGAGHVYLMGGTQSTTGIALGGHQNQLGGSFDSFLVKFNAAGARQWGTYYGGTGTELRGDVAVDGSGNIYLSGHTSSTSGIASGGQQNSFGGGAFDAFLVKFNSGGTRIWGTYYGGGGSDQGWGCAVDGDGNAYVVGFTESASGIAFAGHQMDYGGTKDAFLVKFNSSGQRQWGTYYGGALVDDAFNCAVDGNNDVYLPGRTLSTSGISADGHQNTIGGGGSDAFLVKFEGSIDGITTGTIGGVPFCAGSPVSVPFTVNGTMNTGNVFTAQLSDVSGSFVSPVDIGSLSGTTSGTIDGTIPGGTALGTGYRIRVVASDPVTVGEDNGADIEITAPGSPCDDNDPTTNNDAYNEECECIGEPDCVLSNFTESEPNNVIGEADPLPVDTKIHGSMGACEPVDSSMDVFLLSLPGSGAIQVEACMYNTGPVAIPVSFQLRNSAGSLVEAFTLQAGPDGEPVTTVYTINCINFEDHQLRILTPTTSYCTFYGVTWHMLPPVFAADLEPNNSLSTAIPTAYDTYQEGHLAFEGGSPYDFYDFTPPTDGVMTFEVQAEHAGAEADSLELVLWGVETWILPVGANGEPVTSTVSISCRALTEEQTITLQSFACGTSYRWKYTMTAPVFAADLEPNNSLGTAIPTAYDTYQEGHLAFEGGSPYDFYDFTPPTDGVMTFEVQAEHAGAEADSLELVLWGIETWILPVGANGEPVTSTVSIPCRALTEEYTITLQSFACGTSYRWKYTMTPPVFADDVEPNNSTPGTPLAYDTFTEGHLEFTGGSPYDFFAITPPTNGVMSFEVQAEHVGAEADSMEFHLNGIQTWNIPVGANGVPATSTFSIDCRGNTTTYTVRLLSFACGTSYKWKYVMSAPVFANDVEPNNNIAGATALDLVNGSQYGNIGFHGQSDADYFSFVHPGGPWSVTVSAEHAGAGEGSMTMDLINGSGSNFGAFTVPAGGASTALTSTFELTTLAAGTYLFRISAVTCGVSYLIHCAMDADLDGVCDVADLCPGGPDPGMPCDDGNAATVNDVILSDCTCEGDLTTGVLASAAAESDLRIWPNPAAEEVWIEIPGASAGAVTIVVRDLMGRTALMLGPVTTNAQGQFIVPLGSLTQGTYVIDLRANGKNWSRRVVKV